MTAAALFLLIVSLPAALAAWLGDEGLRRGGLPTRGLWLVSLAFPLGLLSAPLVRELLASESAASGTLGAPVVELGPVVAAAAAAAGPLAERAVTAVWLLLSLATLAVLGTGMLRLAKERSGWRRADVHGRAVFVSSDRGPAVAGTLRPWIVLPEWSLSLPSRDLGLVVLHEEEHVRARDTLLLACGLALVVLTPWNPVTWWQLRGLRAAMEVDCDRRVLRRAPDRRRYGDSLLSVARRASGPSLGLAAFTERNLSLERRILAMTTQRSRWTPLTTAALLLLALLVGVQACGVENPVGSDEPAAAVVEREPAAIPARTERELPAPSVEQSETWQTPFTVAPSILNVGEVREALQREYPPPLREAGIGGRVQVFLFVDETGTLQDYRIDESSGHRALDDAALEVARVFRFSPAQNEDEPIAVWISLPITFQVN